MSARRSFSDERGTGTFHSLGELPKRTRSPVFHIPHDDDDDHSSSSLDDCAIHFPSSSPPPSSPIARGVSVPILLSNGKPLKPSLKSSSSSPAMLMPPPTHHRARSEPSTPKNVHFPEDYGLATICIFNRSARPAALGDPANANGDETETEGEDAPPTRFPFPPMAPVFNYEIDPIKSSPVPSKSIPANILIESLNLSSASFSSTGSNSKPLLTGSVLVRNLAFEKHVAVRFTLDDWQTVSEVGAHYVDSLPLSPSRNIPSPFSSDMRERGVDRFTFMIRLEDYAPSLSTRTLWLAARYRIDSTYPTPGSSRYGPGGEWWDNNGGENYRLGFRPAIAASTSCRIKPRRETVSVPITSPRKQPQPPTTCKAHALGLMVPSVLNKEERRSTSFRAGKLNLCNYVPPTVRAAPSISLPSPASPQPSPPSSTVTNATPSSPAAATQSSDEDTASPASSTLSTPSVSPTIVPRVIIGGQPATSTHGPGERNDEDAPIYSKHGYIADWDWTAPGKQRTEESPRRHVDLVPGSEPLERQRDVSSSPSRKTLCDNNSLYNAFVTQWCFAQGPSPNHHAYDGGGIMA